MRELGHAEGRAAAEVLAELQPDVVYLHKLGPGGVAPWQGCGARLVRMVHDHDLTCPRRHKYFVGSGRVCSRAIGISCWLDAAFLARDRSAPLGLRWVSIGARRAELRRHRTVDRMLVGSRFMREQLLLNGVAAERCHVLPPVVDDPGLTPAPLPDEPNVLYVGQLIRGKGVDLLLAALARIERPLRCELIGAGNAEAKLRAQAQALGLEQRVDFRGWVDHTELAERYRAARLVVVPSRWPEPFGMVGLEAMQQARPVVGFAVGGIPDWLEDGVSGLLVGEQDVAGLAAAIERLLDDRALAARLGEGGRRRVAERYGHARYLEALEQHLLGRAPEAVA